MRLCLGWGFRVGDVPFMFYFPRKVMEMGGIGGGICCCTHTGGLFYVMDSNRIVRLFGT